jgi:hypothetical protein
MIRRPHLLREFTAKLESSIQKVARKIDLIADEDDFTSRLLQQIESDIDGWQKDGIVWRVNSVSDDRPGAAGIDVVIRKLKSKGRGGVEEGEFGADIVVSANINLDEFKEQKGILVQSKRLEPGATMSPVEWERLKRQVDNMLKHTTESYVWIYSEQGVRSIRANAVRGVMNRTPDAIFTSRCSTFLAEFIKSRHGDSSLGATDSRSLRALRTQYRAKNALLFSAEREARFDGRPPIASRRLRLSLSPSRPGAP